MIELLIYGTLWSGVVGILLTVALVATSLHSHHWAHKLMSLATVTSFGLFTAGFWLLFAVAR